MLYVHRVSSCDKRTPYVSYPLLLLTTLAGHVTIDILPDDVLILIFHFSRLTYPDEPGRVYRSSLSWRWGRLVHVCRRWRSVVFSSPNALGLRLELVCRPWSRAELIHIWPPLPIVITKVHYETLPKDYGFDAVVVHRNRVCEIRLLDLESPQFQRLASAMQDQFPALIHLRLGCLRYGPAPTIPDGLLGGSSPRLQSLELHYIAFPALPTLLLSANDLVHLTLLRIPDSAYIFPKEIVTCLAVLAKLKSLTIGFASDIFLPDRDSQHAPPPERIILPALKYFKFEGVIGYLEDFVSRFNAPLLDSIHTIFSRPISDPSQASQLTWFMRRSTMFQPPNEVHVDFDRFGVQVRSIPPSLGLDEGFTLKFLCRKDWEFSTLGFTSLLPSIDMVKMVDHLYIYSNQHSAEWQGNIRHINLFHPFTGVKNLYVSQELVQCIALALEDLVGERAADALPALECIFLEELGPVHWQEVIRRFAAAQRLLGCPIAVFPWDRTEDNFLFFGVR